MKHLQQVLRDLAQPAAYPDEDASVSCVQTHGSVVFLTGRHAYKVKKPVDFGFMDFSTLERREQACRREVLLNRRLCPEVYLDVVPVVCRAGSLRIGGEGDPVDWAVRMRRLPERDMLPVRLAEGTVSGEEIRRVARVLAAFHAACPGGPQVRAYGEPAALARLLEGNFAQMEGRTGEQLPEEHQERIRSRLLASLRERENLFRRRVRQGRVREGHGDLRSQNICLSPGLQDGVQVFDCIEFNEQFRCLDGASDLAYLAIDLELAGFAALREALVAEYEAASGDDGLRELLPFYSSYRAYVRGLIAVLAAEEAEIPIAQRREHAETAGAAFDLARSWAERRPRPALLVTVGLAGSGKSALARELARRLPAVRVSSDRVRKELAGVPATRRLEPDYYSAAWNARVYGVLGERAAEHLGRGQHVILDATFLNRAARRAAGAAAARAGAEFWMVECRVSDDTARRRIRERAAGDRDPSDADEAVYEAQRRRCEPVTGPLRLAGVRSEWLAADLEGPLADAARAALRTFWRP